MKGSSILLQIVLISQRLGGPVDKDLCWGARGPEFNPSERLENEKILRNRKNECNKWIIMKKREKVILEYFVNIKTPTVGFELTTSGLEVQRTERQQLIITNCSD